MVYFSETEEDVITLSLNETTTIEKLEELASLLCGKNIKLVCPIPSRRLRQKAGFGSGIAYGQAPWDPALVATQVKVPATTRVQFLSL
jgi:hypothetical protein